jgi:hypothetical protein
LTLVVSPSCDLCSPYASCSFFVRHPRRSLLERDFAGPCTVAIVQFIIDSVTFVNDNVWFIIFSICSVRFVIFSNSGSAHNIEMNNESFGALNGLEKGIKKREIIFSLFFVFDE